VILPDISPGDLSGFFGDVNMDVMTGGHTHVQFYVGSAVRRDSSLIPEHWFCLAATISSNKEFRADPWAEYAILTSDGEKLAVEFRRVPFDVDKLIEAYHSSERPYADIAIAQYRNA